MNKNKFSAIFTLLKSLKLIFQCSPCVFVILIIAITINSIIPSLHILLTKYIIDALVGINSSTTHNKIMEQVFLALILWGTLHFISSFAGVIYNMLEGSLSDKVVKHINCLIINKSSDMKDLYSFENPDYYDDLSVLKSQSSVRPINLVSNVALNLTNIITIISMVGILFSIHYLVPIILLLTMIPHLYITNKFQSSSWLALLKTSSASRKMNYYSSLMLSKSLIKEIQLYNLGSFILKKYLLNFNLVFKEKQLLRNKQAILTIPSLIINVLGNILIFYFIIKNIMSNNLTYGAIVVFIQVLSQINYYLFNLIQYSSYLNTILLYFDKLFNFLNWQTHIKSGVYFEKSDTKINGIIEFRSVSFNYPHSDKKVLENISFVIKPNQKLAIVGENGAGKSTIVKLLLRYYEPVSGEILYNGKNIKDYNIDSWRGKISAVFQDFGAYNLSLLENIAISNISGDNSIDENKCFDVCKDLGFTNFIENNQIKDFQIGKEFGGEELSGGQCQRLAIARAFYRSNAHIVILDEPTSSLDPLIEAQIYKDFSKLTFDKTSIMVTHRLGSVTKADKVIVLK
jgi:ATP-binding cassette, subfamily B, bacterial